MSGQSLNGVPMREYFERLLSDHSVAHKEHQEAHDREHKFAQLAIDKSAELATQNKNDANEWRDAMGDRERKFVTAEVVSLLVERVYSLERANERLNGVLATARFIGFGGLMTGAAALLLLFTKGGV